MKKLLLCLLLVIYSCGEKGLKDLPPSDGINGQDHRIFVTSSTHNGNLGGFTGADSICNDRAREAGLTRNYKAILSSSITNAEVKISVSGALYKVDSSGNATKVLASALSFWSTDSLDFLSAINLDESGSNVGTVTPWTGTSSSGGGSLNYCSDWRSSSSAQKGDIGDTSQIDSQWVENNFDTCDSSNPIYCISQ